MKKLTTKKNMGNGLIRVSTKELLAQHPEQFDELASKLVTAANSDNIYLS